jgi:large subunit ribosomal protein L30
VSGQSTLTVRLLRSPIGYSKRQKATVRSLGFTRLHQTRTLPDNEAVRGMIAAVAHLVKVQAGEPGRGEPS